MSNKIPTWNIFATSFTLVWDKRVFALKVGSPYLLFSIAISLLPYPDLENSGAALVYDF